MLTMRDIHAELYARGGVEATGIRLTRLEFQDLIDSRRLPKDALIEPEHHGRPARVMGLPVTWVEKPVTPKLLPLIRKRKA